MVGKGGERNVSGQELTLWIELEDMDVAVCVGDEDVQLLIVRQEFRGHDFDVLGSLAEET